MYCVLTPFATFYTANAILSICQRWTDFFQQNPSYDILL